jgi:carbamoyl-phosphate synthase small subunit
MTKTARPAILALENGRIFRGRAFGADKEQFGEVVFNTSMSGYQEILSDPSYAGQIVVMTAPQIGNTGVNATDDEAVRPYCQGLCIRELSPLSSNWRSEQSLDAYMKKHGLAGIEWVDTRALTRVLRDEGAMRGAISVERANDPDALVAAVKRSPSMEGRDLVRDVGAQKPYEWNEGGWRAPDDKISTVPANFHVVAFDFGIKRNILRNLRDVGCRVTVMPAQTPAADALKTRADGYFLSNGPGDPAAVTYGVDLAKGLLQSEKPVFGICLGFQMLSLALGAKTYKLPFGHHGGNHPVKDLATGKVEITAQNHGFAVDEKSLAKVADVTHINLYDQTVEGFSVRNRPVFGVQYHPEASPGPHDANYLFGRFTDLMTDLMRRQT